MNEETYIPIKNVLIKIKYHPDITEKDKEEFKKHLDFIVVKEQKTEINENITTD
jgi:hypothetical protein